jgi:hypothetical protein
MEKISRLGSRSGEVITTQELWGETIFWIALGDIGAPARTYTAFDIRATRRLFSLMKFVTKFNLIVLLTGWPGN